MTTPGGRPTNRVSAQLRSVGELLTHTDEILRAGQRAGATVYPTGFPALDAVLTGGLRSGELALLGGPAGNGKTTIGLQMARNVVEAGGTAVVFSYEHEAYTLLERLVSLEAAEAVDAAHRAGTRIGDGFGEGVSVHEVRAALEGGSGGATLDALLDPLPGAREGLAAIRGYHDRLLVHESSGSRTNLAAIAEVVQGVVDATGSAPLVLVDYLQKVPVAGDTEQERITRAVEGLKDLALAIGAPVVAVSAADKDALASGHRMRTHHLRGTSSLAFEADVVLILSDKVDVVSREHLVYDLGNAERFRGWSVITVEKNRHGEAGTELEFAKDFEHGRFHREGNEVRERLVDERIFTS